jgi:HSP20 family molecular chaperone IbpA
MKSTISVVQLYCVLVLTSLNDDLSILAQERPSGRFIRKITLPTGVNETHIRANLYLGLLTITIRKPTPLTSRGKTAIEIQTTSA